jgi:hypothetical protein
VNLVADGDRATDNDPGQDAHPAGNPLLRRILNVLEAVAAGARDADLDDGGRADP